MRNRLWMTVLILSLGLSACNLPRSESTATPASTLTPVLDTPISSTSISTPVITTTAAEFELPTITPTSTPSVFLASAKDQPVNCRFGPEVSYAIVGALVLGRQAEIIGRNEQSSWWYVRNPSDPPLPAGYRLNSLIR